jgi:hypothetical protein
VAAVPRNRAQAAAARKVVADVRPRAMAAMAIGPRVTADGWKLAARISRRIGAARLWGGLNLQTTRRSQAAMSTTSCGHTECGIG